ncbi:hypothetical protein EYD45_07265 [Hyunsoonleella flava]|uniref:DUF5777 domain-containing protein n=1 Tax=Hyunsoonleella flava TaxID=2527939 RepID=A0A4Q9FK39_9FLAO|nr:DUF5777 family beta-barrel protein [Hyunsoonleella flava]TBN04409.1 hypothetical protein EYD45_07265 [Hyunsoonleella flava]
MKTKTIVSILTFLLAISFVNGQELLDILDKEHKDTLRFTEATFKYSRITYGQSVQTRKSGTLDVSANIRFWNTPEERSQSFFVDRLNTRFALEYGISDRLLLGVGGSTFDERFDGFIKYKLIRQGVSSGSPVTVSLFQNASYFSDALPYSSPGRMSSNRLSFTSQILIAKKITSDFSLQIAPTFVHRGLVFNDNDPQNHFAIGFGGRYKLGGHVSLVSEYYYVANPIKSFDTYGPFSLGINWELSDVMLQFMLTNAVSMVEDAFITQTRNNFNFKNPNLNFGFNFTYTIHFKNKLKGKR